MECQYPTTSLLIPTHFDSCQTKSMNLPSGPDTVKQLMGWARYNAEHLLTSVRCAEQCLKNFGNLVPYAIEIHDAYSGIGTGSWTCHAQFEQLLRAVLSHTHPLETKFIVIESSSLGCVTQSFIQVFGAQRPTNMMQLQVEFVLLLHATLSHSAGGCWQVYTRTPMECIMSLCFFLV